MVSQCLDLDLSPHSAFLTPPAFRLPQHPLIVRQGLLALPPGIPGGQALQLSPGEAKVLTWSRYVPHCPAEPVLAQAGRKECLDHRPQS